MEDWVGKPRGLFCVFLSHLQKRVPTVGVLNMYLFLRIIARLPPQCQGG